MDPSNDMAEPLVILYGPNPEASYRVGGVARWMEYLMKMVEAAGLESRSVYIERDVDSDRWWRKLAAMFVGVLLALLRVVRLARRRRCILHVNTSLYGRIAYRELPIVATSALIGIPVFLQVHGGRLSNVRKGPVASRVWSWILDSVDRLGVHPGPQWREFVAAGYGEKMEEMYNVVPFSGEEANTEGTAAHYLFLGRLTREKGVLEMLEAFENVRRDVGRGPAMTIAGEGALLEHVRDRVAGSEYREDISVEGYVKGDELANVMRRSNVFVLPSGHQEGFPFAFLEAGERGMACLASSESAIGEVFAPGVEYLEVTRERSEELYSAMYSVAVNEELRVRLGRAIKEAVRTCCTIEGSSSRFRKLYENTCAEAEGRATSVPGS